MTHVEWKECDHCGAAVNRNDGSIKVGDDGREYCGFCQHPVSDGDAYEIANAPDGDETA